MRGTSDAPGSPRLEDVLARLAYEGELYERLPEGRVRCHACGHRCVIPPGQRGICKVRWNEDGRLMVPRGYVAALQLDPVEKKPFFHVYPGTRALSFGMLGCDYHCGYCFPAETAILTPNGTVPIKSIFDGAGERRAASDSEIAFPDGVVVVTASGATRHVLKAFKHRYSGPLSVIKPMYLPAVRCTPDHRWLVARDVTGMDVVELPARDVRAGHYVLVPKLSVPGERVSIDVAELLKNVHPTFSIPRSLSIDDVERIMRASAGGESSRSIGTRLGKNPSYIRHLRSKVRRGTWIYAKIGEVMVEGDRVRFPNERRPGTPRELVLDKTLASLLGTYCAEGTVAQQKCRPNSLSLVFSFGPSEMEAGKGAARSLEEVFGVQAREVRRPTTIAVEVGKSSVALVFKVLCGNGASRKRVPREIFESDATVQEAFLEALVAGDGHEYVGGKITLTTVSAELAYGVAALVLRLGRLPSIYVAGMPALGRIQGRIVHRQPDQFSIVWYREATSRREFGETAKHFVVPVRSVESMHFEGEVYNLEVEHEHSYVAGFVAVKNCQNHITSQALRDPAAGVPPEVITAGGIVDLAQRHRARILTSTYNEPLITSEWAVEVFREGKQHGLVCSYVSNGNATPEVLDYLRPWVDLYKVDLKGFDDRHYRKLGGLLSTVLDTIGRLHAKGFWIEVVTLVIPGFNDSKEELQDIAKFLVSVSPEIPWHVTAFHPDYKMMDRTRTTAQTLLRAAEIGVTEGLHYVYAGNLPGRVGPFENTYCPSCRTLLIEREGYVIRQDVLTTSRGICPTCSTRIPGRWS